MKKSMLALLMLLLPALSWADNVPADRARSVAEAFLASGSATRGAAPSLSLVWDGETAATRAAGTAPAFWVFNRTDRPGFVVVAGDDCARPILGWSDTYPFSTEGMPENVKEWFSSLRGQILLARASGRPAPEQTSRAWATAAAADYGTAQLGRTTALWDQTAPYSDKVPEITGISECVTGCVPTAMAIIMKHHRWPDSSVTATTPAYSYQLSTGKSVTISAYDLGHDYDWDKMPDVYIEYETLNDYWYGGKAVYTAEEAEEVATLMRECGMIAQAMYDEGLTSAYSVQALYGMQYYMKYDKGAMIHNRDWYDDATWTELMKTELRDNGPVFYAGSSKSGAHQFILYDYTDTDYFALNWGWGGMANGWYLLSALDPDYYGTGGGSGDPYTKYQSAALGLKPDKTGTSEPLDAFLYIANYGYAKGFTTTATSFNQNESFNCSLSWLYNGLASTYSGQLRISLCDHQGNIVQEEVSATWSTTIAGNDCKGWTSIPCKITVPIEKGYRLRLFYTRGEEWVWAQGDLVDNSIEILVSEDVVVAGSIEERTSVDYDRTTGLLTLQTIPGLSYDLTGDATSLSGTVEESGTLVFDAADFAAGTYTLTLAKDEDSKTLRIAFGTR